MIVDYIDKYVQEVSLLVKDTTSRLIWGKNAAETVVALHNDKVIGVGGLYTNETHPNRNYIGIYVDPAYRRQGVGTELFKELKIKSDRNDFQATISSKNDLGVFFLQSLGFQLARRCFTSILKKRSVDREKDDKIKSMPIEQVTKALKAQLVSLHLDNYRATHEAINPLNENQTLSDWEDMIFEDLDETHSVLLIENNRMDAYILCYEAEDKEEIEIGYIGGKERDAIESYIPFYTNVIDQLMNQFATVSIEADDVDPFAYAALNCYEYDDSESLDAYIL